jgi:hypothetical protein
MNNSKSKFITYIYKITSKQDKFKLFIGSTKQKIKTLFSFFLKDIEKNKNHPNNLYKWIKNLDKTFLKIKLLKSYAVNNKEEQREKEKKWINKYKKDGFIVINNPFNESKNNVTKIKEKKLYVCFENISINELILNYGSNILSISKKPFLLSEDNLDKVRLETDIKNMSTPILPPPPNTIPPLNLPPPPNTIPPSKVLFPSKKIKNKTKQKEKLLPITCGGYMNELKNLLLKRRNSKLGITEIVQKNIGNKIKKKKIKYIPIPVNKKPMNFVEELKMKMKPLY